MIAIIPDFLNGFIFNASCFCRFSLMVISFLFPYWNLTVSANILWRNSLSLGMKVKSSKEDLYCFCHINFKINCGVCVIALFFIMHRVYIWGPALSFSQGLMGSMCVYVCTSVCAHVFTSHAVSGVRTGCLFSIIGTKRFISVSVHNFTTDLAFWWFHLMEGTFLNKTLTFFGSLLFLPHFLVLSYFLNSESFCKQILNNIFGKFPQD